MKAQHLPPPEARPAIEVASEWGIGIAHLVELAAQGKVALHMRLKPYGGEDTWRTESGRFFDPDSPALFANDNLRAEADEVFADKAELMPVHPETLYDLLIGNLSSTKVRLLYSDKEGYMAICPRGAKQDEYPVVSIDDLLVKSSDIKKAELMLSGEVSGSSVGQKKINSLIKLVSAMAEALAGEKSPKIGAKPYAEKVIAALGKNPPVKAQTLVTYLEEARKLID